MNGLHRLAIRLDCSPYPATVSTTAGLLKDAKLIEYSRGLIRILDVAGLEKKACECYHIIKDHLDNYAEFESGITA